MFSFQQFNFDCPGEVILIVPPIPHTSWQPDVKHKLPPIDTVVFSAVHGPGKTGVHGTGVDTPIAAAVAATYAGLLGLMHIGNNMFAPGAQSFIVATGVPDITLL